MKVKSSAAIAILVLALAVATSSFRKVAECRDSSDKIAMTLYQWYERENSTKRFMFDVAKRFRRKGSQGTPFIFEVANFDKVGSRKIINNFFMTCALLLERAEGR